MHIWSLFRFRWPPGWLLAQHPLLRVGPWMEILVECKPTSVGAAESHLCSLSHPHPFPWVSIVPVGLCSEPDRAPDPAVNRSRRESGYCSARSASWTASFCYYTAVAAAREGWDRVERGQEERVNTAPCVHIASRTYGTITLLNRTCSVAKRWACWGLCQSVFWSLPDTQVD